MPLNSRQPSVKPGDAIEAQKADDYNARNAEIERRGLLSVAGQLVATEGSSRSVGGPVEAGFWARLSRNANPYAFSAVLPDGSGGWLVDTGGYAGKATSGELSAYEVNAVAGLNGKVAWLVRGAPGDFRFQWIERGKTPPCPTGTACIGFGPRCAAEDTQSMPPIANPSITMSFSPTDPAGTPVLTTCSLTSCCLTHAGPGTIDWSFTSDNYLPQSGTFAVTGCGNGGGPFVYVYPNKFKVMVTGCNIARDGTDVTVEVSGPISGSCTPTAIDDPDYGHILYCEIDVDAPLTSAPTITVTADRYKKLAQSGATKCRTIITMQADDDYFCCDPTGTGTCKPIKKTCTLSTPLGDIPIDFGGGAPYSITAVVDAVPETVSYLGIVGCSNRTSVPSMLPVTFHLIAFSCGASGFVGTFLYSGCNRAGNSGPASCSDVIAVEDPGLDADIPGVYTFRLDGHCPPGVIGTFHSECGPNRYLSGDYTLTEA
jgi:hypothetical protein